ncbi:MAG: GNAT family N-acetyltransferase [Anaerolineae bacterium]|nr:GNAT family N-acetyltransferase [Anaerolineae bacterium]
MFPAQTQMAEQPVHHITQVPNCEDGLRIAPAGARDCDAVLALFGALHAYNASLDPHFALSDGWRAILRSEFAATHDDPDRLWLLVKDGERPVGLLIAGVHTDSPLFRHRQWVEVQALFVADSHRRLGLARRLLDEAYAWAEAHALPRVQLYVTASNVRAQSVYEAEGFSTSQAIMRKRL